MKRGFTLIEVIITMALTVVMLIAFAGLFRAFNSTYSYQQAFSGTTNSAGGVLRAIEAATRPAHTVLASHAFSQGTYASDAGTLVLELPSVDASGTVLADTYDYAAFYLDSTTAYRLVEADPASALRAGRSTIGTMVTSLAFAYNDPNLALATQVTVDIVASATVRGQSVASHLQGAIRLRNK